MSPPASISSVNIPLFEAELAAFAQAVGASPGKQIVLVLDRAGWHASVHLRVPDHVHLLFLPAYSPELQPAEHLWPLTNTVLANRHFASIEELGGAGGRSSGAVRRAAGPSGPHPLYHAVFVVAAPHQATARAKTAMSLRPASRTRAGHPPLSGQLRGLIPRHPAHRWNAVAVDPVRCV